MPESIIIITLACAWLYFAIREGQRIKQRSRNYDWRGFGE